MTTALRRKLDSLKRLADQAAAEGEAAQAGIERIRARLRGAGEAIEWPDQSDTPYVPTRQWRTGRRKTAAERPKQHRMKVGDFIDCCDTEGTFSRCRCGNSAMQVVPGVNGLSVAMLYCLGCRRSRKLRREHFEAGGRHI